jgi:hypothetical protein
VSAALWVFVGWWGHTLLGFILDRLGSSGLTERDAMNRRIGWGYGYGAGVVDGKHGRYVPGAPPDGRVRS